MKKDLEHIRKLANVIIETLEDMRTGDRDDDIDAMEECQDDANTIAKIASDLIKKEKKIT